MIFKTNNSKEGLTNCVQNLAKVARLIQATPRTTDAADSKAEEGMMNISHVNYNIWCSIVYTTSASCRMNHYILQHVL